MISHRGYQTATPQRGSDVGAAALSQRSAHGRAGPSSRGRAGRLARGGWLGEAGTELRRAAAEVDPGCGRHSLCSSCGKATAGPWRVLRLHCLVGVAMPAWAAEGGWGWLALSRQQLCHWCDLLRFHRMLWTPLG